MITASREVNCQDEKGKMTAAQYERFYPFRASITESKAFMRAIRSALGLAATYTMEELKKPFIVAHVVPNFDDPTIKDVAAANFLQASGLLFTTQNAPNQNAIAQRVEIIDAEPLEPEIEPQEATEAEPAHVKEADQPKESKKKAPQPCSEPPAAPDLECCSCGKRISENVANYSIQKFGMELCVTCQKNPPQ